MSVEIAVDGDRTNADLLEFDVDDISNLAKAALEVLLARVFREATNVDLIRLDKVYRK